MAERSARGVAGKHLACAKRRRTKPAGLRMYRSPLLLCRNLRNSCTLFAAESIAILLVLDRSSRSEEGTWPCCCKRSTCRVQADACWTSWFATPLSRPPPPSWRCKSHLQLLVPECAAHPAPRQLPIQVHTGSAAWCLQQLRHLFLQPRPILAAVLTSLPTIKAHSSCEAKNRHAPWPVMMSKAPISCYQPGCC